MEAGPPCPTRHPQVLVVYLIPLCSVRACLLLAMKRNGGVASSYFAAERGALRSQPSSLVEHKVS